MDDGFAPVPDAQPPRGGGGRAAAIILAVLFVIVVAALGVLFFTGAVRIGTPRLSRASMAARLDGAGRPVEKKTRFSGHESRIYCCGYARAFEDTVLEARWYIGGALAGKLRRTFASLTGNSSGRFLTSGGNVVFYLDRPRGGWTPGRYTVELLVDGKKAAEPGFTIEEKEEVEPGTSVFEDPQGRFTVRYPEAWSEADPQTLSGALAGFVAPGPGSYPPRFAVLVTDFNSASPDYLNGLLQSSGAPPEEMFTAYSLGDRQGARRTYQWDCKVGDTTVRLKSVQVVVQGSRRAYGLNCHSLATDFEANLPVFNSIINSFRLYD